MKTQQYFYEMGAKILDACIEVHRELGPGLLESVYEVSLMKEFELRNMKAESQIPIKVFYKGFDTQKYFKIDILVDDEIILEFRTPYPIV